MARRLIGRAAARLGPVLLAAALMSSGAAQAGNQKEEELADPVRLALEHARHCTPSRILHEFRFLLRRGESALAFDALQRADRSEIR